MLLDSCDNIAMTEPQKNTISAAPANPDTYKIAYIDRDLLVIDKPYDLLTVPGRGIENQDCLINRLLCEQPNARIVHRLDYATSGLVIIPLSYDAQKSISRQFEQRTTHKQYIAIVHGIIKEDSGVIDLPLICDWPNRPKQMVDFENGKSAQTEFKVLARDINQNSTRVELKPITGRSHQLRVHMLALGHPILGDRFYASGDALNASNRLLLHAQSISFDHPESAERLHIEALPQF